MVKLTYQENELRVKARLVASLLRTWEAIESRGHRTSDECQEAYYLSEKGLVSSSLNELTPKGKAIIDAVLAVNVK